MENDSTEKVRPFVEKIYSECKANGLTLKEFCTLAGLLSTKAHEMKTESERKMLGEKLQ